jgi:hypothetical protein
MSCRKQARLSAITSRAELVASYDGSCRTLGNKRDSNSGIFRRVKVGGFFVDFSMGGIVGNAGNYQH